MDEPFNALDPRRRSSVRRELRAFQRERALTSLQVTHDFTEAGLLGDVAILLDSGRVLQSGPPATVFRRPATPYVAEFLGAENVFAGTVHAVAGQPGPEGDDAAGAGQRLLEFQTEGLRFLAVGTAADGPAYAVIRAEEIIISLGEVAMSARNRFRGTVTEIAELGALTRVVVEVGRVPLIASLTTQSATEIKLGRGREVYVSFKAMAVHLC